MAIINFVFTLFSVLFTCFPVWFAIAIVALVALAFAVIVIKLIAFVWDSLPFV